VGKCARMKVRREREPRNMVDNDLYSPLVIVHVQYPPTNFYATDMHVLGFKLTYNSTLI
jgi:hypothetical protein